MPALEVPLEPKVSYTPLSTPALSLDPKAGMAVPWASVPLVDTPPVAVMPDPPPPPVVPEPPAPPALVVPPPSLTLDDDSEGMLPAPNLGGEEMMPPPFAPTPMPFPPAPSDVMPFAPDPFAPEPFDADPPQPPVMATSTLANDIDEASESNPYKGPSPTMITKMNPAELRKLAERLVKKGALTDDDYQAAKKATEDD